MWAEPEVTMDETPPEVLGLRITGKALQTSTVKTVCQRIKMDIT